MANEDKVVDFGAACYAGLPDGSPVHTGVCLHLDVVFEQGGARLKHFVPSPVAAFGKTKAVAANHHAVLQYDPVAKAAKFTHDGVRVREEIVANLRTAINCNETVQHGVAPNDVVFEQGGARLKHFVPSPVAAFGKTKAVAANHHAVLQYDPVAKAAKFTHDGVRVREEIVANLRTAINCNETVQHGVAPNFDVF